MTNKKGLFSWLKKSKKDTLESPENTTVTSETVVTPSTDDVTVNNTVHIETVHIEDNTLDLNNQEIVPTTELAQAKDEINPTEIASKNVGENSADNSHHELVSEQLDTDLAIKNPKLDNIEPDFDNTLSTTTAQENTTEQTEHKHETNKKVGLFSRLFGGLSKTRFNIGSGFLNLLRGRKIDDELFDELEEQLLIADLGVETTRKIMDNLIQSTKKLKTQDSEILYQQLKVEMSALLAEVTQPLIITEQQPFVLLMVGVNGVGKTTTIGKLAHKFQQQGKKVLLAAGDTFRAAAVEQLQVWGERNNIPVIAQQTGADAASVIYDAIASAKTKGYDVVIADTAGRLQNKDHLMNELKKIVKVIKKHDESAPHEIMLVLDASTGQNAISQTKLFNEAVGLTGLSLTKLDGTAKGGIIFSLADQFHIPVRYIGVGEQIEDLQEFNNDSFIQALFTEE